MVTWHIEAPSILSPPSLSGSATDLNELYNRILLLPDDPVDPDHWESARILGSVS